MKKKMIFNIFFVALFMFFVGSFSVDAITCEYPFTYTDDEGKTIKATITTTEVLKGDWIPLNDKKKIVTEFSISGLDRRSSTSIYYHSNNSSHSFVFDDVFPKDSYDSKTAESRINDSSRKCEDIYYSIRGDKAYLEDVYNSESSIIFTFSKYDTGKYTNVLSSGDDSSDGSTNGENDGEEDVQGDAGCSLLSGKVLDYLRMALKIIQIAGPLLAIVLGMADFVGAVLSSDDGAMKKAMKKFITRLIAAAALFLIPVILEFLLDFINRGNTVCL